MVTKYNCKKVDFGIVVFLDTSERGVIQIAIIFLVSFRTYIVGTVLTDTLPVSSTIDVFVKKWEKYCNFLVEKYVIICYYVNDSSLQALI